MIHERRTRRAVAIVLAGAALAGCNGSSFKDSVLGAASPDSGSPMQATDAGESVGGSSPDGKAGSLGSTDSPAERCVPAEAADQLKPRSSVMNATSDQGGGQSDEVFVSDLFSQFKSNCGACHVEQNLGMFQVGPDNFASIDGPEALRRLHSDDPNVFMPPPGGGGKPFSMRSKGDPVYELATLLEAWINAGKPKGTFSLPTTGRDTKGTNNFRLRPSVGAQMTNIGNCIPDKAMLEKPGPNGAALDKFFETAKALPERLEQTDLTSLDTEELAREGVIAFAPAYTLWADNAKKIRLIRVPRGTSVAFDKGKQSFTIPANTRFYKTFLKRVIDLDGKESYRKIETRLIVSRPDNVLPDGSRQWTALFGTYAWNEQETEAILVRDPLRDGTPFRDRLLTYVIDEQKADSIIADAPEDLAKALDDKGYTRTYAIPGSERCIQCHMGAPAASFILGFTPLQIHRRPSGEGGVIEPAKRDELNQLQRLIDYGVISGMAAPDDVKLLEDSQGDRRPRNEQELIAQGYMVGNCAHCHNPFGFPSVTAPELRDVLNFLPGEDGGIFQFPLDKLSPRLFRGATLDTPMPYITPSLFDFGDDGTSGSGNGLWQKTFGSASDLNEIKGFIQAPWRAVLYRNVDAPFSYSDDTAIFPRMPRHTPGYDCRVRQIMGSWMVSIPAVVPDHPEVNDPKSDPNKERQLTLSTVQPYVEVKPGDPGYDDARKGASERLKRFSESARYGDCPDSSQDIVNPVLRDNPNPEKWPYTYIKDSDKQYALPMPSRPHWFVTDLTNPPGDWFPRRADWADVFSLKEGAVRTDAEKTLIEMLKGIRLSQNQALRDLALGETDFGLWREKQACKFPSWVKTVAQIPPAERPAWIVGDVKGLAAAPETAHVYRIATGAQLFTSICRNCHGPEANAKSRLADTIADLTGGDTRVANLRDGIFGPPGDAGMNRERVFGALAEADESPDDVGARYLVWMTLGGTRRRIPIPVLQAVSSTLVLGEKRIAARLAPPAGSANMLQVAKSLCREVMPSVWRNFDAERGRPISADTSQAILDGSSLIFKNGDAAMWQRLCTFQNPQPVMAITALQRGGATGELAYVLDNIISDPTNYALYDRDGYKNGFVGDENGAVSKVTDKIDDANLRPWCFKKPTDPSVFTALENDWKRVNEKLKAAGKKDRGPMHALAEVAAHREVP